MDRKVATIQDVARMAGVSTATVSRTLSKPSVVAPSTREAVLGAVEATGYRLNAAASNLRRQRAGSVIALIPNLSNPFFSQILAGLSSVLSQAQLGLLVADTQAGTDPDERLSYYLSSGQADGLILFDGCLSPEPLQARNRPPVLMACEWMGHDLPSIRVDNQKGVGIGVAHLAGMGHRRIGHITGPRGNVLTTARRDGYVAALQARGLSVREDWIYEGDFSMDSGVAAARIWLEQTDRPTAVFSASDEMAVGFMGAVQRRGIAVPDDVSIIGFDNIEMVEHLTPALTTIRQPRTAIGARAAELLLAMIEAGSLTGPSEVIDIEFVARESVCRIPS